MIGILLDALRCGACGGDQMRLFSVQDSRNQSRDDIRKILIRCVQNGCGMETLLTIPPPPRFELAGAADSPGRLCGGWGD